MKKNNEVKKDEPEATVLNPVQKIVIVLRSKTRYRNYLIAMLGCVACTIMSSNSGNIEFLIKSDINVAVWLFVAWLFDDK